MKQLTKAEIEAEEWHKHRMLMKAGKESACSGRIATVFKDASKNRPENIIYLGFYHPYWIRKGKEKNPKFDYYSNLILRLKESNPEAIDYFFQKLDAALSQEIPILCVPSHDPSSTLPGTVALVQALAKNQRIDATSCLVRVRKIAKLSYNGNRGIGVHLGSIAVKNSDLIRGTHVLLLDDVKTTGNSLKACKQLLIQAGVKSVQCLVLAKTISC